VFQFSSIIIIIIIIIVIIIIPSHKSTIASWLSSLMQHFTCLKDESYGVFEDAQQFTLRRNN